MTWDLAAQIATSLGAVIAVGSLVVAFVLYRRKDRDELATGFGSMIATTRPRVKQLNDMVSYELARELASTVVYSRDLELPLRDLYAFCRPASGEKPDEEKVKEFLENNFPPITVPLNTSQVVQYQGLTASVSAEVALYQMTFPGVFRVVSSVALLLSNVVANEKGIARDEELWKAFLPTLLESDPRITDFDHMKSITTEFVTGMVMSHMAESRKQIALLTQMLDLVSRAYLDKSPRALQRLSKKERKEKIRWLDETDRIPEDLREAENCLRHAFTNEAQFSRYRELLDSFEASGEKKDDQQPQADQPQDGPPPEDGQPPKDGQPPQDGPPPEDGQPPRDEASEALKSAAGTGSPESSAG